MYKNIIPELVSLDTKIKKLKWSYFLQNLDFYDDISYKNKFHYKMVINNDIEIPQIYDFRSIYFIKKGEFWYYQKKFLFFNFKFKYDVKKRTFYFNRLFKIVPFNIGGLIPIGTYLTDIINMELFLNGYINYRGCALKYKNKIICFTAPGFNGKTSFLLRLLGKGAKYISEDNLLIDFSKKEVYPTANIVLPKLYSRGLNRRFKQKLNKNQIITGKQKIDKLFLIQNSTRLNYSAKPKNLFEFTILNSLYFFNNFFIRSYLFENKLINKFDNKLEELKNTAINYEFISINNFNFNKLIKDL
jgi:hypothetical protein